MARRTLRLLLLALMGLAALVAQTYDAQGRVAVEQAFNRMYNFDFPKAYAILNDQIHRDPSYPLAYSVRGVALLFSELHRTKILEIDFFTNDNKVTGGRLKPDPAVRAEVFQATAEARQRAAARLAVDPQNRDAMFALCMATGVETDYTILVEKRYFRSFSLSRQSQFYARRLLSLNPPVYDAYLTLGMVEYVVGSLNPFFRLFVHFDQIKGSKQQAVENLKKVVAGGQYYPPFAKILLSVIYLREKQPHSALTLLTGLAQDFPENPLLKSEVRHASQVVELASAARKPERHP